MSETTALPTEPQPRRELFVPIVSLKWDQPEVLKKDKPEKLKKSVFVLAIILAT